MPWITDCRWTRTSICVSVRLNRRAALIRFRPLFIIVAQSMLIFAPIHHMGWRSAVSPLARAISSSDAVREGAPTAEAARLLRQQFGVAPGDQSANREPPGRGAHQQIDRLGAHAAGTSQHGDRTRRRRLPVGSRIYRHRTTPRPTVNASNAAE